MRLSRTGLRWRPIHYPVNFQAISILLVALSGCREHGKPDVEAHAQHVTPEWHTVLDAALQEAGRLRRPLLVASFLGDLSARC